MFEINPINSSLVGAPLAQNLQSTEKSRLLRQAEELRNRTAELIDEYETQIENTEQVEPVDDQEKRKKQPKKEKKGEHETDEEPPARLDLTA